MTYVYVIRMDYKSPAGIYRGSTQNMAFKTELEAKNYCKFHSNEYETYSWRRIPIGKFKKPK